MTPAAGSPPPIIEWAVSSIALDGHSSGDLHCVVHEPPGALVGAIDGLGHGQDAARAAHECALILETYAHEPLPELVRRCHDGLRATRGVALTLGRIDRASHLLTWLAVGNVDGLVLRRGTRGATHDAVLPRGGVVGYHLPPLKLSEVPLEPHDLIVMATDGIRSGFASSIDVDAGVQQVADELCSRFARGTDDALALVVRYLGGDS